MCYIYGNAYQSAGQIFEKLRQQPNEIPEYLDYFYFRSLIGQNKRSAARSVANLFLEKYSRHYLADSLRLGIADFEFKSKNYRSAEIYYSQLTRIKSYKDLRSYLETQIVFLQDE